MLFEQPAMFIGWTDPQVWISYDPTVPCKLFPTFQSRCSHPTTIWHFCLFWICSLFLQFYSLLTSCLAPHIYLGQVFSNPQCKCIYILIFITFCICVCICLMLTSICVRFYKPTMHTRRSRNEPDPFKERFNPFVNPFEQHIYTFLTMCTHFVKMPGHTRGNCESRRLLSVTEGGAKELKSSD